MINLFLFFVLIDKLIKVRVRDCEGAKVGQTPCPIEGYVQTQPCGGLPCARWAAWGDWGHCSATCGEGEKIRKRFCNFGDIGDDGCAEDQATQSLACQKTACCKFIIFLKIMNLTQSDLKI